MTSESPRWGKSTYSSPDGGNCVEWAPYIAVAREAVLVRDSKYPDGPALGIPGEAWAAFVGEVKGGGFEVMRSATE
ncbi:DUF397 domain-containing protein [Streptomyces varsoviensis]|uniref:DUF397 domain-containing protein n=1 Tax=Streptomyces varsoviensis TaxID=67373 RepID=A0ABR5JBX1_9ACTN|nr:DUF397 domain-containing protein [Streptomyces varsoviensis]KOG90867.1 hypothetical protein ADK38_06315 [Streptomyces varsoviensis]